MNQTTYTRSSLFQPISSIVETAAEEANRKIRQLSRISRVAPSNPNQQKINEDIDDDVLERCTRCPPHRKRKGKFRPLIGNDGEFLCDPCYVAEFPATAFVDENKVPNGQRRASFVEIGGATTSWVRKGARRITGKVRNKASDLWADAMGETEVPNNFEESSKNENGKFPSEIECRMCLEKGVFRRCCSAYYCHLCYYKSGTCPGCEKFVPLTGIAADEKDHPGTAAITISWAISAFVVAITLGLVFLFYWNISTSPTTVWGHSCRGFFATCDLSVCIDYDGGKGYGKGGLWIPTAEPYRVCDRESTTKQVVASACIYDNEMYVWSNKQMGYDICVSSPREKKTRPRKVSSTNPLMLYSDSSSGVYIFDDDFEYPPTVSAPWQEIVNGNYSDACGVNANSPARGNHGGFRPVENSHALVFTGVYVRHAITQPLNVEYGGSVEFYLKMGQISNDPNEKCRAAYNGDVTLEYCIALDDDFDYCFAFGHFPAWKYRGESFQFVSVEIPDGARSNATSFRFRQDSFDELSDHWAIDDFRIRANLKPGWSSSSDFKARQNQNNGAAKRGACCYSTDQCSIFDKITTHFQESDCDSIPQFDGSNNNRLKSSELYILFSLVVFIAKGAYKSVYKHYTDMAKNRTYPEEIQPKPSKDQFPRRTFRTVSHLSWECSVATLLVSAFASVVFRLCDALNLVKCFLDANSCEIEGSFVVVALIAIIFDARSLKILLFEVLVIQKPVEILVDLHPDNGIMQTPTRNIPLADVSAIQRRSTVFVWLLGLCHILAGLPIALGSLTLRSYKFNGTSELLCAFVGCMSVSREIYGVSFLAKLFLLIEWIFVLNTDKREDFGRAVRRKGLLQQALLGSSIITTIVMSTFLARNVGNTNIVGFILLFGCCVLFGGLFGILLGIVEGLPVTPEAYLTGWPSPCYCITCYHRTKCPCLFSCTNCGEINSRQVLVVVTVQDMHSLEDLLKGTLNIEQ